VVLQQIAEPLGAVLEQLEGVRLVGVLGQDDDPDLGMVAADRVGGLDALQVVGRHADVREHHVGRETTDRVEKLFGVPHRGNDLDLTGVLEQPARALANQVVVLCDHDPEALRQSGPPPREPGTGPGVASPRRAGSGRGTSRPPPLSGP
jgi:hypothetical protein